MHFECVCLNHYSIQCFFFIIKKFSISKNNYIPSFEFNKFWPSCVSEFFELLPIYDSSLIYLTHIHVNRGIKNKPYIHNGLLHVICFKEPALGLNNEFYYFFLLFNYLCSYLLVSSFVKLIFFLLASSFIYFPFLSVTLTFLVVNLLLFLPSFLLLFVFRSIALWSENLKTFSVASDRNTTQIALSG